MEPYKTSKADTPEMIQQCLNCTRPECINCYAGPAKRREAYKLCEEKREMIKFYAELGYNDVEIARRAGLSTMTVNRYRRLVLKIPANGAHK